MRENQMADFFRSLGHKIVQTRSCFWYSSHRFLYKNLPIHRNVDPSESELAKVMLRGTALAIRYPGTPGEASPDGGIYVCADRNMTSRRSPRTLGVTPGGDLPATRLNRSISKISR